MQKCLARLLPNIQRQQGIIERIVRVDHAGEYAAYKIYAGQMRALRGHPVCAILQEMQDQEQEHLHQMERFCAKYDVMPTVFTPLYHFVAYGLGYITGRLGKETAMACTVAVEEHITQHYNNQIRELVESGRDKDNSELLQKLSEFRDDEMHHHDAAIENDGLKAPFYAGLKFLIQTGCKAAILVSSRI